VCLVYSWTPLNPYPSGDMLEYGLSGVMGLGRSPLLCNSRRVRSYIFIVSMVVDIHKILNNLLMLGTALSSSSLSRWWWWWLHRRCRWHGNGGHVVNTGGRVVMSDPGGGGGGCAIDAGGCRCRCPRGGGRVINANGRVVVAVSSMQVVGIGVIQVEVVTDRRHR